MERTSYVSVYIKGEKEIRMKRLLTYAEVKKIFGWTNTSTVRRYVYSGDLDRVQMNASTKSQRITEESAHAFLERLKSKYEQESYAARAEAHTAKMRKGRSTPEPEVLLDAEDIIRQSRIRTPDPQPKPTFDEYIAEKRDAEEPAANFASRPARSSGLSFRTVRGL